MDTTALPPELHDAIVTFMEYHPPTRVSRTIRTMLMEALTHDLLVEDVDFKDLMHDVDGLFSLLDTMSNYNIGEETEKGR